MQALMNHAPMRAVQALPVMLRALRRYGRWACITLALLCAAASAQAADGCKFLLCIAGPWASIAECRPTVLEVFRDLARGRPLPSCSMSGDGNAASNLWTSEATCPAMYRIYDQDSGGFARCLYPSRVSVQVNGALWSHVYWDFSGNSTTWYSGTAKSMLSQGTTAVLADPYETDLRNWNDQIQQCTARGGTSRLDDFGAFEKCIDPWWWGDGGGGG